MPSFQADLSPLFEWISRRRQEKKDKEETLETNKLKFALEDAQTDTERRDIINQISLLKPGKKYIDALGPEKVIEYISKDKAKEDAMNQYGIYKAGAMENMDSDAVKYADMLFDQGYTKEALDMVKGVMGIGLKVTAESKAKDTADYEWAKDPRMKEVFDEQTLMGIDRETQKKRTLLPIEMEEYEAKQKVQEDSSLRVGKAMADYHEQIRRNTPEDPAAQIGAKKKIGEEFLGAAKDDVKEIEKLQKEEALLMQNVGVQNAREAVVIGGKPIPKHQLVAWAYREKGLAKEGITQALALAGISPTKENIDQAALAINDKENILPYLAEIKLYDQNKMSQLILESTATFKKEQADKIWDNVYISKDLDTADRLELQKGRPTVVIPKTTTDYSRDQLDGVLPESWMKGVSKKIGEWFPSGGGEMSPLSGNEPSRAKPRKSEIEQEVGRDIYALGPNGEPSEAVTTIVTQSKGSSMKMKKDAVKLLLRAKMGRDLSPQENQLIDAQY